MIIIIIIITLLIDFQALAEQTEGYSGSDIRILCKESAMSPVRKLLVRLERGEEGVGFQDLEPVVLADVEEAIKRTGTSVQKNSCDAHLKWQSEFGSY